MTDASEPSAPYLYCGPLSGVTLASGQETLLVPGATVHLPPAHEYTRTLVARGHLSAVPGAPASTDGKTLPSTTTRN